MNYLNARYIQTICEKINMPEEPTKILLSLFDTLDYARFTSLYEKLILNFESAQETANYLNDALSKEENGQFLCLLLYLAATGYTHEQYQKMSISDNIYYDTMDCFREYTQRYFNYYGEWGFDVYTWPIRHIHQRLYQLGRLGFETCAFRFDDLLENGKTIIKNGDPILSVHIPENGKLIYEDCAAAYQKAREFFAHYYPDYGANFFYCGSWLLMPCLKEMLPPDSNIIKFQSDFTHFKFIENTKGALPWIFGKLYDDINLYPTNTSLRRKMVDYLKADNPLGEGVGYFKIQ